jgi:hypothetical protein
MSIDSEFDRALEPGMTAEQWKETQLRILVTHSRMANAQLAEFTVAHKLTDKRLDAIETSLEENTQITTEVRELLTAFKGGMRVLGWLGTFAKWAGGIAGACVALYSAWYALTHGGDLPGSK